MRLSTVESGHRMVDKLMLGAIGVVSGGKAPDVLRVIKHRPELFGAAYSAWVHEVLRGPSSWTAGERELFAAHVSTLNHCLF